MLQLLIAALILVSLFQVFRWLRNASPAAIATGMRRASWIGGGLGAIGLLGLILTRQPGFAVGLLFFFAPLILQGIRRRWFDRSLGAGWRTAGTQPRSEVTSRYFAMSLDHATGAMHGRVLEGRFAGRQLGDLQEADLMALLRESAGDGDSARLFAAYLDRRLGSEWRRASGSESSGAGGGDDMRTRNTDMSIDEAWEVLGLTPGAAPDEIRAAHRRLMRMVHPDHGGSDYLAARVNRAKDLLLGQ